MLEEGFREVLTVGFRVGLLRRLGPYDDRAAASVFSCRMLVCFQDFDVRQAVGGEGDGFG